MVRIPRQNMNANDRDTMRRSIIMAVRNNPGICGGKISEQIGRSSSVIDPFLYKLVRTGALEIRRSNRKIMYYTRGTPQA